jgi:hypothetical protein
MLLCGISVDEPAVVGAGQNVRHYELSIIMDVKMKAAPSNQLATLKGSAQFRYTLKPIADGVEVSIDELAMTTEGDAAGASRFRMNRNLIENERGDNRQMTERDSATPRVRAMLDTFGTKTATITLDSEGRELDRKLFVQSGPLAQPGIVDDARTVHVRFPAKQDRWEAPVVLPMADGQAAKGTLTFEKAAPVAGEGKRVRVKVFGKLTADGKTQKAEIRNGVYNVSGEQVYDPKERDWVSASWQIESSWEMLKDGILIATASGPIRLSLKQLERESPAVK